jgi:hypothetical protein
MGCFSLGEGVGLGVTTFGPRRGGTVRVGWMGWIEMVEGSYFGLRMGRWREGQLGLRVDCGLTGIGQGLIVVTCLQIALQRLKHIGCKWLVPPLYIIGILKQNYSERPFTSQCLTPPQIFTRIPIAHSPFRLAPY